MNIEWFSTLNKNSHTSKRSTLKKNLIIDLSKINNPKKAPNIWKSKTMTENKIIPDCWVTNTEKRNKFIISSPKTFVANTMSPSIRSENKFTKSTDRNFKKRKSTFYEPCSKLQKEMNQKVERMNNFVKKNDNLLRHSLSLSLIHI